MPDLNDPEVADAIGKLQKGFRRHEKRKEKKEEQKSQQSNNTQQPKIEIPEGMPDLNDPEVADAIGKLQKGFRRHEKRKEKKEEQKSQQSNNSQQPKIEIPEGMPDLNDPEVADAIGKIQKGFKRKQKREEKKEEQKSQ